jgi:hypothetical protein
VRKDLGIYFEEANSNGARLPVAILFDGSGTRRQALGYFGTDTSADERLTL